MSQVSRIYSDEWSVVARLREVFDASKEDFIPIIREVVGAMADAVDDDPSFTSGMFGHIHGVRNTRGMFRQKGWKRLSKNGNELVKHPEKDLSVGYQTVDLAANSEHRPKAISGKGAGAKQIIDESQATWLRLFDSEAVHPTQPTNTGLWHLCVSVDEDDVRAEISLSSGVTIESGSKKGNFDHFIERIFLIQKDEWGELLGITRDDDDDAIEFEPVIQRK